jgi:uridine phosphorylase
MEWAATFRDVVVGWLFDDLRGPLPATLLLPLENPDLHHRESWDAALSVEQRCRSITVGTVAGRRVGVLTSKMGAPAVAMTVDAAAGLGAKVVVGVGFCGGISHRLGCGDLLVPAGAVTGDGTSAGYVPERYPAVADRRLATMLIDAGGAGTHEGLVWSLDAALMEDSAFVMRATELGVDAVDMETAALLTVARLRGMRACGVLVVSDHPGHGRRADPTLLAPGIRRSMELAFEVAPRMDAG